LGEALLEELVKASSCSSCGGAADCIAKAHASVSLLSRAAAAGSAAAAFTLGSTFASGLRCGTTALVLRDEEKARVYFEHAKALAPSTAARIPVYLALAGVEVSGWWRAWMDVTAASAAAAAETETTTAPTPYVSGWSWVSYLFSNFFREKEKNVGFEDALVGKNAQARGGPGVEKGAHDEVVVEEEEEGEEGEGEENGDASEF